LAERHPVDETRKHVITRTRLLYLYRTLAALCVLAAIWAILLWLTGGFRLDFGGIRISSQRPHNALVISLGCAAFIWLLTLLPDGRAAFLGEWAGWRQWHASRSVRIARAWRAALLGTSALALVAFTAVDVYQWLAALPLWVDEEMIALNVRDRSVAGLAGPLWMGQSAPFGWLVLERAALTLFGTGEAAVRALALLFGLAGIGTAVWVGRRWMRPIGAAVFVLLYWISSWLAHYRFEVKHYTADALFGLMLPALAVWAIEGDEAQRVRRLWIWWATAAIGQFVANGALLATPACAIFLCVAIWRRDGVRAVAWFAGGWLVWLVSFGIHYLTSIRYTLNNAFLRSTWSTELIPPALGLTGVTRWFFDRLEPLALNPGGTSLWILFWASALTGFVFSGRRQLSWALAGIPASAFALAAVVPLHQRFSIWIVPAMYAGVSLLIDRAVGSAAAAFARRQWALFAVAALVLAVQARLTSDVFIRGKADIESRLRSALKHQLDDRAAVRWLMSQAQPGDVLVTTHLALPAVWWYGNIPLSDQGGAGSTLRDGSPIYEVDITTECGSRELDDALRDRRRVLLYLGFDVIQDFDPILLRNLSQLGDMTANAAFGELGRAAVIDLRLPPSNRIMQLQRDSVLQNAAADGCVSVKTARRW
jgi:hypothetical protein